jgi:hypothetical protein
MSARMTAMTGGSLRRAATCPKFRCAKSTCAILVMRGLARSVAATMLAAFCVGGVAMAEADWPLEGRWAALNQSLTFDLSLCGDSWCGVEVTTARSCGRTLLRTRSRSPEESGVIIGRLELAAQAQPYTVALDLFRRGPDAPRTLMIRGNSGGEFNFLRRMYPYMVAFDRVGDATCRHDPKVS